MKPLPSLDDYLAALPKGVASYPDAQVKGSVLLSLIDHPGFEALIDDERVPQVVRRLIQDRPVASSWISEVHFNALVSAFYDVTFRDAGGVAAYDAWVTEQNSKLFRAPLYRALFVFVSPERLLGATSARWTHFRRGTSLAVVSPAKRRVEIALTMPPYLEPVAMLRGLSGAFRAAVRAAGGDVTSLHLETTSPTEAHWSMLWQ